MHSIALERIKNYLIIAFNCDNCHNKFNLMIFQAVLHSPEKVVCMKSIWLFSIFRLFELLLNFKEAGISFHKVKTVNLYHVATTGLTDFAFSTELRLPSFEIEI